MSQLIHYRRMELRDIEAVLDLLWIIFEDMELPLLHQYPYALLKQLILQGMHDSTFRYSPARGIVAIQEEQVVGVIFVYPGKEQPSIDDALNRLLQEYLQPGLVMFEDLETSEETYYIDALVVHPVAQKQGIAKNLIHQAKQKAKDEGYNRLDLNCDVENDKAKHLYESLGFNVRKQRNISSHLYDEMTYLFGEVKEETGERSHYPQNPSL